MEIFICKSKVRFTSLLNLCMLNYILLFPCKFFLSYQVSFRYLIPVLRYHDWFQDWFLLKGIWITRLASSLNMWHTILFRKTLHHLLGNTTQLDRFQEILFILHERILNSDRVKVRLLIKFAFLNIIRNKHSIIP